MSTKEQDAWIETFLGANLARLRTEAAASRPEAADGGADLVNASGLEPPPPLGKAGSDGAGAALAKPVLLWDRTRKRWPARWPKFVARSLKRAASKISRVWA
jgi:hypothetical protein